MNCNVIRSILCSLVIVITITSATTVAGRSTGKSGLFNQKDAVALYNRYREALEKGDYNTFLECIYEPGKPDNMARVPKEAIPKKFILMKEFILETSPDLAASKILKFAANDEAAILVVRIDLENVNYVTLSALKFAILKGKWKVLIKAYDDTFPSKNPEVDKRAIKNALKENPNLQLAAVIAEAKAIVASRSAPPPASVPPTGKGQAKGVKKAGPKEKIVTKTSGKKKSAPEKSIVFNDSPEHRAITKMLKAEGETDILQTASSVGMVKGKDFATVGIEYSSKGKTVSTELYLFKEGNGWLAYRELPTHKDHSAVFSALARRYCAPRYKHLQGIGFHDDSWKNKNPKKRTINVTCSELINRKWQDHRLSLVFEYHAKKGWYIADGRDLKKPTAKTAKVAKKKVSLSKEGGFSGADVNRFFLSIMRGDIAAVKSYLDAGMSPNTIRPRLGHSPLHAAVLGRKEKMALMLLRVGADPNIKDENNSTPLITTAGNCKSIALVKALIDAGADVNATAKGGGTPLMFAEVLKCRENVKMLRKAGAK